MSTATTLIGLAFAVGSAAVLSVGNLCQSKGVTQAHADNSSRSMFMTLLRTPIWLVGSVMFGLAIALQMASLAFAPIMLVQPLGVLALVFSVLISTKLSGVRPSAATTRSVTIAVLGVACYVAIASGVTKQGTITDAQLRSVIIALLIALAIAAAIRFGFHNAVGRAPILYVFLAGMFSAFVATLGKTVIMRVQALFAGHHFSLDSGGGLTIVCLIGVGIASALSIYFTQTAYTCNSSDVVVAGLTVVDPAIAVVLGITIFQEAAHAPMWSMIAISAAGAVAIFGVIRLARAEEAPQPSPQTKAVSPSKTVDTASDRTEI